MSLLADELASALPEIWGDFPTENVTWSGQTLAARVTDMELVAEPRSGRAVVVDGRFTVRIQAAEFATADRPARGDAVTCRGESLAVSAVDARPGFPLVTLTLSA
jgi:hypothetical protein